MTGYVILTVWNQDDDDHPAPEDTLPRLPQDISRWFGGLVLQAHPCDVRVLALFLPRAADVRVRRLPPAIVGLGRVTS